MSAPAARRGARPGGPALGLAAAVAAALLLPRVVYPVLAADIVVWGLFAVAFNLLLGGAGLLSFGHAAFWGAGAYATAYALGPLGWPLAAAVPLGAVVALALAVPISALSVRRSGIYFAMITLAFAQMVYFLALQLTDLTGGENGLQGVPRPSLFGLDLSSPLATYHLTLAVAALGFWLAWRVARSPFGRVLAAVRDNEPRARALGYRSRDFKLSAMLVSATLSGLAGALYAVVHGVVGLETVRWQTSGEVVMMAVLGGFSTLWGPVAGAAIVLTLRDRLAELPGATGLVTGLVFIVTVLVFRRGVVGSLIERLERARRA